jgi:hypothetical protein
MLKKYMSTLKVLLVLCVFIRASMEFYYMNDYIWQCIWLLSLLKLVELSDE